MTLTLHTSSFAWCNDWQLAEKTFAVFNVFICAVQLFFPGFFLRLPVTGIYSSDIMAAAAFSKMQNTKAVQNQATGHIYLSPFWRQGEQNAGSSFFPIFFVPISLLIEADLYQAPFALTPVTVTGYPLLHHSGLLTAEWQLDNPLWNDLGVESARPLCRWTVTPQSE